MQHDLFAPPAARERGKWPSEQLADYLEGRDANPVAAIRSWAAYYIHDAAVQVCGLATKEKRRTALGRLPDAIRPLVENEAKRIWPMVRG